MLPISLLVKIKSSHPWYLNILNKSSGNPIGILERMNSWGYVIRFDNGSAWLTARRYEEHIEVIVRKTEVSCQL